MVTESTARRNRRSAVQIRSVAGGALDGAPYSCFHLDV